jgi:hypothetical protein
MQPFTKDDYIALWRSVLPRFYTEPLETEADGRGFDVANAQAAIFARFEAAANVSQQAYFLRRHSIQTGEIARGPRKASGYVVVSRLAPNLGDILIQAGAFLEAEQLGTAGEIVSLGRYVTTADFTIPEGSGAAIQVPVEAEFQGYTGNLEFPFQIVRFAPQGRATVPCTVTSNMGGETHLVRTVAPAESYKWDVFTRGMLGRYVRVVQVTVPLATPQVSLIARRIIATWQAGPGTDQLAIIVDPPLDNADIGKIVQVEVEELSDLGVQVEQPDLITGGRSDALGAIGTDRRLGRVQGETDDEFAERIQSLADNISPAAIERIADSILGPLGIGWCLKETADLQTLMGFTWDTHPWDFGGLNAVVKTANSQLIGQGIVWLDWATFRRFFIICVDRGNLGEFGFGYDYTNHLPGAPNAWDVAFYDGSPVGFDAALGRLWTAVNDARAAGVGFLIMLDCC